MAKARITLHVNGLPQGPDTTLVIVNKLEMLIIGSSHEDTHRDSLRTIPPLQLNGIGWRYLVHQRTGGIPRARDDTDMVLRSKVCLDAQLPGQGCGNRSGGHNGSTRSEGGLTHNPGLAGPVCLITCRRLAQRVSSGEMWGSPPLARCAPNIHDRTIRYHAPYKQYEEMLVRR
jgi:hypothetical protein